MYVLSQSSDHQHTQVHDTRFYCCYGFYTQLLYIIVHFPAVYHDFTDFELMPSCWMMHWVTTGVVTYAVQCKQLTFIPI